MFELTVSEKALFGLLAGVPFILNALNESKQNQPIGSHQTFSRTLVEFTVKQNRLMLTGP